MRSFFGGRGGGGDRLASFSPGTDDTVGDDRARFLQGHEDSSSGVELLALGADCKGDAGLDSWLTQAEPGQLEEWVEDLRPILTPRKFLPLVPRDVA